jgi:hypothetical protein
MNNLIRITPNYLTIQTKLPCRLCLKKTSIDDARRIIHIRYREPYSFECLICNDCMSKCYVCGDSFEVVNCIDSVYSREHADVEAILKYNMRWSGIREQFPSLSDQEIVKCLLEGLGIHSPVPHEVWFRMPVCESCPWPFNNSTYGFPFEREVKSRFNEQRDKYIKDELQKHLNKNVAGVVISYLKK